MQFEEVERDLVMLQHNSKSNIRMDPRRPAHLPWSSTVIQKGYSAMAKLVGVPCGVAVKQVLHGTISDKEILAPMSSKISNPLVEELKKYGITIVEKTISYIQIPMIP